MALRVAFQMDPLAALNPGTDSTFMLVKEAQKRGHTLYHYTPGMLSQEGNKIRARGNKAHFDEQKGIILGESILLDLRHDIDLVWMRQDPPFNMAYISACHILERLMPDTLVVNDPYHVRNLPEKIFPLMFSEFMPATLVTADRGAIRTFLAEHHEIVIKPLHGHGGHGVLKVKTGDSNLDSLLEMTFEQAQVPIIAQRFLPEVKDGDRRVILIDGKVSGILGRIPAEGEIRANFRVGGSAAAATLTARQREICLAVGPELEKRGLIFTGLDLIGDYLTEINITSPTGIVAMNKLYGKQVEAEIWDAVEKKLQYPLS